MREEWSDEPQHPRLNVTPYWSVAGHWPTQRQRKEHHQEGYVASRRLLLPPAAAVAVVLCAVEESQLRAEQ